MHQRIAVLGISAAALIVGACADREGGSRLPAEPNDATPTLRYVTTASAAVVDPHTHRLIPVKEDDGARARVLASVVAVNGGESDVVQLSSTAPGVERSGGYVKKTFVDASKHKHTLIFLYKGIGGPPAAIQHYIDGVLASTSAYTWARTSAGWVRTSSFYQAVHNGSLYGTYSTVTVPRNTGGSGPPQTVRLDRPRPTAPVERMLAHAAYVLAFAFAPQDATAQFYFLECMTEWLRYAAASAAVAGVYAAIIDAPYLTPVLIMQLAGALGLAGVAEDMLISCMLAHDPSFAMQGFSGGGAGSSSGAGSPAWDCFIGSYAAHCTTPFTL
jgi:hypothetical protein